MSAPAPAADPARPSLRVSQVSHPAPPWRMRTTRSAWPRRRSSGTPWRRKAHGLHRLAGRGGGLLLDEHERRGRTARGDRRAGGLVRLRAHLEVADVDDAREARDAIEEEPHVVIRALELH